MYDIKIAIIGTGGIGGYFGGRLAQNGNDVTFLARGEHLKAIKSNGLSVKSISGDFRISPAHATDKIEELEKSDLIILGIKAWQVKEMAKTLTPVIYRETVVIPLQNGVEAINELKEQIDPGHVIGGLCRIISKIESPGVINHNAVEPTVTIGEIDNANSERINNINDLFNKAGINTQVANDISAEIWKKFIFISVGGLLALTQSTFGEIRSLPQTRQLMIDLLNPHYS